ncbi:MAG TPA: hypothetical protein VF585_06170 [Chthoniobacterales bacterium]|jgi:uncharacterized membrane protein
MDTQTALALLIVLITLIVFVRSWWVRREKKGCGSGCGCGVKPKAKP